MERMSIYKILFIHSKKEKKNNKGSSPLTFAVRSNNVDAVRILIEHGALVNQLCKDISNF